MIIPPTNAETGALSSSFEGQLLIAMPSMPDERFSNSVIYVCAHSDEGAMGLVINMPAGDIDFSDLAERLPVSDDDEKLPASLVPAVDVLIGGPVDQQRGFVLHSPDYQLEDSTLAINSEICLTATLDIVMSIAAGQGPEHCLLALGYAGWAPGQLENEMRGKWLAVLSGLSRPPL